MCRTEGPSVSSAGPDLVAVADDHRQQPFGMDVASPPARVTSASVSASTVGTNVEK